MVNAALMSKTRSGRELSILGDQVVSKRLQRVEGVARVEVSGLTVREVRIDLDPQRLRAYGVTPAEISAALGRPTPTSRWAWASRCATRCCVWRAACAIPRQFEQLVVARRGNLA